MTAGMHSFSIITSFHLDADFRHQKQKQSEQDKVIYLCQQHYLTDKFPQLVHVVCVWVGGWVGVDVCVGVCRYAFVWVCAGGSDI